MLIKLSYLRAKEIDKKATLEVFQQFRQSNSVFKNIPITDIDWYLEYWFSFVPVVLGNDYMEFEDLSELSRSPEIRHKQYMEKIKVRLLGSVGGKKALFGVEMDYIPAEISEVLLQKCKDEIHDEEVAEAFDLDQIKVSFSGRTVNIKMVN